MAFFISHLPCVIITVTAIPDLPGAITLGECDILNPQTHNRILHCLNGRKADVVMRLSAESDSLSFLCNVLCFLYIYYYSDMAPNSSGIHDLDHHRIMVNL